jgi:tryptophanyl-tRNA synthetase
MAKKKLRILSGMRPTGRLHLGNYVGALQNWVTLQNDFDNYFFIADWHALTTNLATENLRQAGEEMVLDWLSAGIDAEKSPVFRQSDIKEHAELHLLFSMLVTKARLERNPTLKEQVRDLKMENMTYGHLGYPVLQAADILMYKAHLVPVGEDQQANVEITREIARKFNSTYREVFPIPKAKLTTFPRLPGLDGKKMSKSLGNTIFMSDGNEEIEAKVRKAVTDPQKLRRNDPGRPEVCTVYTYHTVFNSKNTESISAACRSGELGCVDCKKMCAQTIGDHFAPMREKRMTMLAKPGYVRDVLMDGGKRAAEFAKSTMQDVREAMQLD